jgi:molybdate transport system ATP-binding protein
LIALANIVVQRGVKKLFSDFNFKINAGENWVIQGANGSGKTTLLQLIAGVLHPTSGKVSYDFIHTGSWDVWYQQRVEKLHLIPAHSLQTFLSGYGGLFYQQRYYSIGETELPRVREVFGGDVDKLMDLAISETFNVTNLLDLELTRLSNGQLKKVLIMSNLVKSIPNFLLLDYPYDGLDQQSRRDLNKFLTEISVKLKIQLVIVDHGTDVPVAINRRLVLDNFQIQTCDAFTPSTGVAVQKKQVAPQPKATHGHPVVDMQNLTIQYNGIKIIENLSWKIHAGERWALTGRNGSGKTTLFSLIYADHPMAYSQKVFLFGRRRGSGESIWDIKKRINYCGPEQIHFLNPGGIGIAAREYIISQSSNDQDRLGALIDFFDADKFIDVPVRLLSSGQLQLMMLMIFFGQDKEVLLLDEPFQFLDPANHEKVTAYLNHYLDKKITLILITHNEDDVLQWTQLRKHLE